MFEFTMSENLVNMPMTISWFAFFLTVQPIIGEAPAFLEMLEHVSRAAPLGRSVLVVGERGTGKELIASRLHYLSERWERGLVKVNCADLPALAEQGRFRRDLLDRLAFDVITVPPLRERVEDILPLAYPFAINMASELRHSFFPGFSSKAASALLRHQWPGNVRELKNAVERSVYRSEKPEAPISKIAFDPFDSPFKLARTDTTARHCCRPTSHCG